MTFSQLTNIMPAIPQSEGLKVEFKTTFNSETVETLVAFVNAKGGAVYVGVKDNGEIVGVQLGKESTQQWANEIKSKTEPSIIPDIETIEIEGKQIVVLSVTEFPVKPIAMQGKYYKRIDKSNHLLSVSEISDLYMQTMQYSWDAYFSRDYSINDLDFNKVQKFIDKVNSVGRFSLDGTPIECLEKLKYISKEKITNAAVLLFGKGESSYNVHLGRFKTESMIIDDKMLRLSLFDAVEETQKYLISQMKVAFEITGLTTQRTEILEYPVPAIRELILNCLIHRDYLSPIDVQIKVFDNYITFFNPGKLYGELTIEDLQTNTYQASTRNKLIAEAFYLTGDIEKYGSGFRRIKNEIKQYPTMKLGFTEIPNGFLATVSYVKQRTTTKNKIELKKNGTLKEENGVLNKKNGTLKEENGALKEENGVLNKKSGTLKEENGVLNNEIGELKNELKVLLQIIKDNSGIKLKDIPLKINRPLKTIQKQIKKLIDIKLIRYTGSKKTGGYQVI